MPAPDLKSYWEDRLSADWTLQGVGFRRLGRRFNEWAYRLRGERFDDVVAQHVPQAAGKRVLDVGSGTGFYIDGWLHNGATDVVGLDLTDVAVANLTARYPEIPFVRADVSTGVPELDTASFDVITAMDVMFHITDDEKFAAAITEIARLLKPGGLFIWSDHFLHKAEVRLPHVSWRSLYRSETILNSAGFDIVDRTPMFVVMAEPHDVSSKTLRKAWYGLMWLSSQTEWLGNMTGRATYAIDHRLTARLSESPTTEIMTCRRR